MHTPPEYRPLPPAQDDQIRGYAAHGFALCALRRELDWHGAVLKTTSAREPAALCSSVVRLLIGDAIEAWTEYKAPTALDLLHHLHSALTERASGSYRVDAMTFEVDHALRPFFAQAADRIGHAIARTNMVAG